MHPRRLRLFETALTLLTAFAGPCLARAQQVELGGPSLSDIPCSFVNETGSALNLSDHRPIARPTARVATGSTGLAPLEKLECLLRVSYSTESLIWPGVGASKKMIFPPQAYSSEWRAGFGAFARNYGDVLVNNTANRDAKYLSAIIFHEDTRYWTCSDKRIVPRVLHLIVFSLVDKSDSGKNMLAISNLFGAAAGGFIGNAYLPQGYANVTHAGQRSLIELAESPLPNLACEFTPEFRTLMNLVHLPFLNKPLFSKCAR